MKEVIKEARARQEHMSKPWQTRAYLFFSTKKRRVFYLVCLGALYYKWQGMSNFFSSRS